MSFRLFSLRSGRTSVTYAATYRRNIDTRSITMSTSQRSISSSSSRNAGRNIVVLLDGTGNEYGHKNSNLIKLMSVLKVDTESQLCYYSSGLGEFLRESTISHRIVSVDARNNQQGLCCPREAVSVWSLPNWHKSRTSQPVGESFRLELRILLIKRRNFETFVCDAYKYLMDTYRENDKIYIFGFSRGAYTARALAGMLQRVGLLMPNNHNQIPLFVTRCGMSEIDD